MRWFNKDCDGNAYVFVLVIMMCTFSMLAVSLHTVSYEMKVSEASSRHLNIYGMAESGAGNAEKILNNLLAQHYNEIFQRTVLDVLNVVSEDTVEYRPSVSGLPYDGSFRLKLPNSGSWRGESDGLFKKYFIENASEIIPSGDLGNSRYTISLTEKENSNKSVYIVEISPAVPTGLTSLATLQGSAITATMRAEITLGYGDGSRKEILHPRFKWLTPPDWTVYGAVASGEIKLDGEVSGSFFELMPELSYGTSTDLPGLLWSPENPIAVVSGAALDISAFYMDDEPIYTAVISEGGAVTLYTSDNTKNQFNGIVFSYGDIEVHEINTTGSLVSLGEIRIMSPEWESVIFQEPDALFKINISDGATRYRLYDYLGITDFASGGELRAVLDCVTLQSGGVLEIFEPDQGPLFRIKTLREVRDRYD